MAPRVTQLYSASDVYARLAGDGGSSLVSYRQTGSGAALRSVQDHVREWVSAKDFSGVLANGTNNDSQGLQNAVNAASASGKGGLYLPAGQYSFENVTIREPIMIRGDGGASVDTGVGTQLIPRTTSSTLFTVDCLGGVTFKDFIVTGQPQVSGAAFVIKCTDASAFGVGNLGTTFQNVRFDALYDSINFSNALLYNVSNCGFWNIVRRGCTVANSFNSDQGDGCFVGNYFQGGASTVAVYWAQGGAGMRFVDNKCFTPNGIVADLSAGTATGQMIITNNSFDQAVGAALSLTQSGGITAFGAIIIGNNIFAGYGATVKMIDITGIAAAHINTVLINDNIFAQSGGSLASAMISMNYVDNFVIAGNVMTSDLGTAAGIEIAANVTGGLIAPSNVITGFANTVTNVAGRPVLIMERAGNGWKQLYVDYTNSGTIGAVIINKAAGRCNVGAGNTSVTVTNSFVTAASKVLVAIAGVDANSTSVRAVVPGAGSFTITLTAAPAGNLPIDFFVVNTD